MHEAMAKAVERHEREVRPRLDRLWRYYRNEGRGRGMGQVEGLPSRLRGARRASLDDRSKVNREIVIENDIAWRVQARRRHNREQRANELEEQLRVLTGRAQLPTPFRF